ncbi:MAG: ribosome maturation factor RimM [Bosea sp. (in: a-proteobacteria)]
MGTDRILLGRIGRAQGLKGEVRLTSFTADPVDIASYGALENEDGTRRFEIERISQRNDVVVAKLKSVNDRSGAEALTNQELWIARDKLAKASEEDEYLLADLIGCAVHAPDGEQIGTVADVPNYGAGDLIEIALAADAKNKTVLVPFTRAFVPEVDVKARRIVADVPPELMPDAAPEPAPDMPEG